MYVVPSPTSVDISLGADDSASPMHQRMRWTTIPSAFACLVNALEGCSPSSISSLALGVTGDS